MIVRHALLSVLVLAGCRGEVATDCASNHASSGQTTPFTSTRPPALGACDEDLAGAVRWFAVTRVALGGVTASGKPDPAAWKAYGFDLDSRNTTREGSKTSVDTCQRRTGSGTTTLGDGNEGIDNNFGQHVLAAMSDAGLSPEATLEQAFDGGSFALLLRIESFGSEPDTYAPAAVYLASRRAGDRYALTSREPIVRLPGYVVAGFWVSLSRSRYELTIRAGERDVPFDLRGMWLTMRVGGGLASFGTVVPLASAQSTLDSLLRVLGACENDPHRKRVLDAASLAVDLVADAPNSQDTRRTCDALSVGLGFTLVPIADHDGAEVAPRPSTPAMPCADLADAGATD